MEVVFLCRILVIVLVSKSHYLLEDTMMAAKTLGMFNGRYLFITFFLIYRKYIWCCV